MHLHFTEHPNFCGIGVVDTKCLSIQLSPNVIYNIYNIAWHVIIITHHTTQLLRPYFNGNQQSLHNEGYNILSFCRRYGLNKAKLSLCFCPTHCHGSYSKRSHPLCTEAVRYTEQITSAGLVHKQQPHAAAYNTKHSNDHRPDENRDLNQSYCYTSMLSFLSLFN